MHIVLAQPPLLLSKVLKKYLQQSDTGQGTYTNTWTVSAIDAHNAEKTTFAALKDVRTSSVSSSSCVSEALETSENQASGLICPDRRTSKLINPHTEEGGSRELDVLVCALL